MAVYRYVVPFAAGVAVGAVLHRYWPELQEAAAPPVRRALRRARTAVWERAEQFADLVAEIREEERASEESPG